MSWNRYKERKHKMQQKNDISAPEAAALKKQ